ncbi:MAG: SHOCT-like domain-containing protein [Paraclostridium sp.]|uniref:SHOCT-like domain-containing protein n=1 Tax=Paraclostridium sp. TaxID=2023273 RepID=UPI003F2D443F
MEDKKRILKMVEDGKISAEEGIKLLDALENNSNKEEKAHKEVVINDEEFLKIEKNKSKGKMIYIRVISSDGERVKVNIPVEFLKILGTNTAMGGMNLEKHNVDINSILSAVENGFEGRLVEVDSNDGDKVIVEIG